MTYQQLTRDVLHALERGHDRVAGLGLEVLLEVVCIAATPTK